jgi:small conductance mechanosensitive channel
MLDFFKLKGYSVRLEEKLGGVAEHSGRKSQTAIALRQHWYSTERMYRMGRHKSYLFVVWMLCISCSFAFDSFGREAEQPYSATTVSDPQIPVEDLELLLRPLTKDELLVEAQGWLELLKEKVRQISMAEIQMRQKSRQIDKKEDEIEQKIEEIEETEKQVTEQASASEGAAEELPQKTAVVAEAEREIQEKVENIQKAESEIQEIAVGTQAKLESKPQEELSGSEEDLKEKTEEVIEATEKIKDTVAEIAQSDIAPTEKVKQIVEAEVELHAKVKEQLLVSINKLREEQTALIDRFNVVLGR